MEICPLAWKCVPSAHASRPLPPPPPFAQVLKDRLTSDQARSDARSFWLLPNGRDLTLQQCLAQAQSVPIAIKVTYIFEVFLPKVYSPL